MTLSAGSYHAQVSGKGGTTGVAIVEAFAISDAAKPNLRLVNISTRGSVGTGDSVMIPGFITEGNAPRRPLVRGVRPGLAPFGVSGLLADLVLNVYVIGNDTPVATSDDWTHPPQALRSRAFLRKCMLLR